MSDKCCGESDAVGRWFAFSRTKTYAYRTRTTRWHRQQCDYGSSETVAVRRHKRDAYVGNGNFAFVGGYWKQMNFLKFKKDSKKNPAEVAKNLGEQLASLDKALTKLYTKLKSVTKDVSTAELPESVRLVLNSGCLTGDGLSVIPYVYVPHDVADYKDVGSSLKKEAKELGKARDEIAKSFVLMKVILEDALPSATSTSSLDKTALSGADERGSDARDGASATAVGSPEHVGDPSNDVGMQLAYEFTTEGSDVLHLLVRFIFQYGFEARKDFSQCFSTLVRRHSTPVVAYIATHPSVLEILVHGYECADVCLHCGSMLRECMRSDVLCRTILHSSYLYDLFAYVDLTNFDIASDAFQSFKELLTRHKKIVSEFLNSNFESFFTAYHKLLKADNYVTRRQSLKLLGELLLDRANFRIMKQYINDANNLKVMMTLLRDKSRSIQFEAFQVFKVFVANPKKSQSVEDILRKNKEKLISFLANFQKDKDEEDSQFAEEKALLISTVEQLEQYTGSRSTSSTPSSSFQSESYMEQAARSLPDSK